MLTGYWGSQHCMYCELDIETKEGIIKPALLILLNGDSFFASNEQGKGKRKVQIKDNSWLNCDLLILNETHKLHYHVEAV